MSIADPPRVGGKVLLLVRQFAPGSLVRFERRGQVVLIVPADSLGEGATYRVETGLRSGEYRFVAMPEIP